MRRLLLLLACLASPAPLLAGAWTAEPGAMFLSVSDGPDGSRLRLDRYVEYGWAEGVTLGVSTSETRDGLSSGFDGRVAGFVRQRLWQGAGAVASLEAQAGGGMGAEDDPADTTLRLLLGRGFATSAGNAWAEAAFGWRAETGYQEDHAVADLTLGLRPARGWIAMAGAHADLTADRRSDDWEAARVSFGAVREIRDGASLSLRAEAIAFARNEPQGVQVRLGFWQSF